jgi:putative flippase GtrA
MRENLVKTLWNRQNGIRFLKYMVGGGLWFWSGYAIFALCYSGLHWRWWQAKLLGDFIGWSLNYLVQRYWAFASSGLRLHEMEHATRYVILSSGNVVIDYLIVGGLYAVGITPYIGAFISSGFFTLWNFLWYRYWVFPETSGRKHPL